MKQIINTIVAILFSIALPAIGQTIDSKIIENGGIGEYKAIAVSDSLLPGFTIYRPQDLQTTVTKEGRLPLLLFANGGCANINLGEERGLNMIASNGYIVIAIGPFVKQGSNVNIAELINGVTSAYQLLEAIDIITKENFRQESEYYNKIDINKVAVNGCSCGGLQAISISYDPRIKTTIMQNSGVFGDNVVKNSTMDISTKVGARFVKDDLKELHAPILYVIGNETDIAYPNAMDDYERINHIPIALASYSKVGHEGTYKDPNGGVFSEVKLAWLDWQLKGKFWKSAMFIDENYAKEMFPDWSIKSKNVE